ncbi:MAG: imidazoleglycerol-phosphate dehydratase HisB [Victivallaceae bacterium]|nr:imidazoleglycerol-phosphate dehydratase HisB [Victivallaceae bacterium]
MEMLRSASVSRKTRETDINVTLVIDGSGKSSVSTGVPFLDHMLELWARHGFFDLEIKAQGDLQVDGHHTFEDLGLVLGEAFLKALGDKVGIRRYGQCLSPMDETLAMIALDLSGRPGLYYDVCPPAELVAGFDARLFHEFFQAFCVKCGLNLHIRQIAAGENHHLFEAVFKGLARALDAATQIDPRINGVLSTKGSL